MDMIDTKGKGRKQTKEVVETHIEASLHCRRSVHPRRLYYAKHHSAIGRRIRPPNDIRSMNNHYAGEHTVAQTCEESRVG